tara:strand:- start:1468 stop:1695 length:228 start_codon:yes stop_codon:yes gene_type:complete
MKIVDEVTGEETKFPTMVSLDSSDMKLLHTFHNMSININDYSTDELSEAARRFSWRMQGRLASELLAMDKESDSE